MDSSNNALCLLHTYELSVKRQEATTRSTLKKMLIDVAAALDEYGKITIFVERSD